MKVTNKINPVALKQAEVTNNVKLDALKQSQVARLHIMAESQASLLANWIASVAPCSAPWFPLWATGPDPCEKYDWDHVKDIFSHNGTMDEGATPKKQNSQLFIFS